MHRPFPDEEEGQDFALINRFFFNGEKHNHNWEYAFSGIFGVLIMDHYLWNCPQFEFSSGLYCLDNPSLVI